MQWRGRHVSPNPDRSDRAPQPAPALPPTSAPRCRRPQFPPQSPPQSLSPSDSPRTAFPNLCHAAVSFPLRLSGNSVPLRFPLRLLFSLLQEWIQLLFPRRPVLPPRMQPYPPLGMCPHNLLDDLRKARGIFQNVALRIARTNQLHRRLKSQPVLSYPRIPVTISGHDGSVRMQGHPRNPCRRTGRRPKKVHKHTLLRHSVLIRKNPHRPLLP